MEVWDKIFWVPFAAIGLFLLYRFFKFGSLRGVLYGSPVSRTIGEFDLQQKMGGTTTLRVHVLENGQIVLEYATRAALGASMSGTPLTTAEADRLIALLRQARS